MRAGVAIQDSGRGAGAAGLDLRAIDRLGVKRPFSDIAVARAALRGWDS